MEEQQNESSPLAPATLEEFLDERFVAAKNRLLPRYKNVMKRWDENLRHLEQWYRKKEAQFSQYADFVSRQYTGGGANHPFLKEHNYHSSPADTDTSTFIAHDCHRHCWTPGASVADWKMYCPFTIPILMNWKRIVAERTVGRGEEKFDVYYIAPCGRTLRSYDEVQLFLDMVGIAELDISQFTFDPHCMVDLPKTKPPDEVRTRFLLYGEDISCGKERRPVSWINRVSMEVPDEFTYITERSHEAGINLPTNTDFLISCDCTDNCQDHSKCQCWKLTIEESKTLRNGQHTVGYVHRRLPKPQHSAIYECNPLCSCGPRCCNKVVQNGLQFRLQVFRTKERGWGLMTLDDIPQGSFICTYIGHVYTEQSGDENGAHYGDEYFAELDYMEVMEMHKDGYESDVECPSENSSSVFNDVSYYSALSVGPTTLRLKRTFSLNLSSEEEEEEEKEEEEEVDVVDCDTEEEQLPVLSPLPSFVSQYSQDTNTSAPPSSSRSSLPSLFLSTSPMKQHISKTRSYYHENHSYLMDAKLRGNLGRYINHSCSPNMFVQNVFIDTHDLRFPWVAYFAKKRVKAGSELTWDYNYEVGSVEGKEIQCLCGAQNCRKRLL